MYVPYPVNNTVIIPRILGETTNCEFEDTKVHSSLSGNLIALAGLTIHTTIGT